MRLKFYLPIYFLFLTFVLSAQDYVAYHGQLSISGTKIVNQYGDTVSFAGPSLFWSNTYWGGEKFYNSDVVSWVHDDWEAPIIRASMGVDDSWGYLQDTQNKTRVKAVIDAAIANGMYVIIDWHSHHAEDYQSQAVTFFTEMANTYGKYPNIIYEIYNEPLNVSWSSTIKPYAEAVIHAIRMKDKKNIIVVGTPNWSQDVDVASLNPITAYDNIAYSLHFYAGTHKQDLRNKATTAMNNGIALVVTEWGTVNANGDGGVATASVDEWVTFMKDNDLTNCNWALNDKSEGASALVSGASTYGFWDDSDLTASGLFVKYHIKDWEGNYVEIKDITNAKLAEFSKTSYGNIVITPTEIVNEFNYQLVTMDGKVLQRSDNVKTTEIQTSQLPKGIYIIKVEINNEVQVFKFVK
jgi:endoglucanase